MKQLNFPFTAILGQDRMRKALILNVIDPKIGGVLLTGHQGTGKSTAVRSLRDILPDIEYIQDCLFSCNPKDDMDNLCDSCKEKLISQTSELKTAVKPINLVDLPLGVTEDMVAGSLDLEKVLKEGIKSLHPGLLAKANRGILYIDEINLLQDHIVDILLDAAASGVNIIEREGVSISHPARFILVGSMNPEEGELRPQINDRLGLEVTIDAPQDPKIRANITRSVMEFSDNPKNFIEKFEKNQEELKEKIINAIKILDDVEIPSTIYEFASKLVTDLGILSQRADITFVRCARANAAFEGRHKVELVDFDAALDLVFEHRLRTVRDDIEPEEIRDKMQDIYGKIKKAYENEDLYKPNRDTEGPLKQSDTPQTEYRKEEFDDETMKDVPELKDQEDDHDNKDTNDWKRDNSEGIKVMDDYVGNKFSIEDLKPVFDRIEKRIVGLTSILKNNSKRNLEFSGRGSRTKITTSQKGRYISYKHPIGTPKQIAFDASIKRCLIRSQCRDTNPLDSYSELNSLTLSSNSKNFQINTKNYDCGIKFPILMEKQDIMEKVFEFKAPLSMYFILDASGSMSRYIKQMADIIKALHREGYEKKDKTSIVVFKGKKAHILQRPTTNVSRVIAKLPSIQGTSYTPMMSAINKVENMIKAEKMKNKDIIPVIIICSDLGANVSMAYPELKAQTRDDFRLVSDELKVAAKRLGRKRIRTLIMIPKKGRAIKFLGVYPWAIDWIKQSFQTYASAEVFEFDGYNPKQTIIKLKKVI